jgi:hypothetical protein
LQIVRDSLNRYEPDEKVDDLNGKIHFGNLQRVVKVRNALKKYKMKDSLYCVTFHDIKKFKLNEFKKEREQFFSEKIVKTNFKKDTVTKYIALDGKYL